MNNPTTVNTTRQNNYSTSDHDDRNPNAPLHTRNIRHSNIPEHYRPIFLNSSDKRNTVGNSLGRADILHNVRDEAEFAKAVHENTTNIMIEQKQFRVKLTNLMKKVSSPFKKLTTSACNKLSDGLKRHGKKIVRAIVVSSVVAGGITLLSTIGALTVGTVLIFIPLGILFCGLIFCFDPVSKKFNSNSTLG